MGNKDEEDYFKRDINLIDFARSYGYEIDQKESYSSSYVLRGRDGNKIQIVREANAHWVYFSFHNLTDNGSIFDFVLNRSGQNNFGKARREIREWVGGGGRLATVSKDFQQLNIFPEIQNSDNREGIHQEFQRLVRSHGHSYLVSRGIEDQIVRSPLFVGQILEDERGNVVFPHRNKSGICGFEKKNKDFRGFSAGGRRGLWRSNKLDHATDLVVGEAVLDVISYSILKPKPALYVSTSGGWGPGSLEMLNSAIAKVSKSGTVWMVFDHDEQGRKYADQLSPLCRKQHCSYEVDLPGKEGFDWNQLLMAEKGLSR